MPDPVLPKPKSHEIPQQSETHERASEHVSETPEVGAEADLRKLAAETKEKIVSESASVIAEADKVREAPSSLEIDQETAKSIFETSGFAGEIDDVRREVKELDIATQKEIEKIVDTNVVDKKPNSGQEKTNQPIGDNESYRKSLEFSADRMRGMANLERSEFFRYPTDYITIADFVAEKWKREQKQSCILEIGVGNLEEPSSVLAAANRSAKESGVGVEQVADLTLVEVRSKEAIVPKYGLGKKYAGGMLGGAFLSAMSKEQQADARPVDPPAEFKGAFTLNTQSGEYEFNDNIKSALANAMEDPLRGNFGTPVENYIAAHPEQFDVVLCNNVLQHLGGDVYENPIKNPGLPLEAYQKFLDTVSGIMDRTAENGLAFLHTHVTQADKQGGGIEKILDLVPAIKDQFEEIRPGVYRRKPKTYQELNNPPTTESFPTIGQTNESIQKSEKKAELERKLREVVAADNSHEYAEVIAEVRQSKIDWANTPELARRLKLKGANNEDVVQIRNWLVSNAQGVKTYILPPDKFEEVTEVLHEMSGEFSNRHEAQAFYVSGGREDVPEDVRNAVFLRERPPIPPLPPTPGGAANPDVTVPKKSIDTNNLHHEVGHATQDGLLDSELYQDWERKIKAGAPDPEYIGSIRETDTRVRSMFRDLSETFDPTREPFSERDLATLRRKQSRGELSQDTLDLLRHYDDSTLIEIANNLPAI